MLHEYKTTTNMTQRFAALASIAQNPGKTRDDVLADFYGKWQHDFLVNFHLYDFFFVGIILLMLGMFPYPFFVNVSCVINFTSYVDGEAEFN